MDGRTEISVSGLEPGDRVRICRPGSEYTGCRGSIAPAPGDRAGASNGQGSLPLGYFVAIDGENGIVRPFLLADIELLRPASVRRTAAAELLAAEAESGRRA